MHAKQTFRPTLTAALLLMAALTPLSSMAAPPPSWTPDECCELVDTGASARPSGFALSMKDAIDVSSPSDAAAQPRTEADRAPTSSADEPSMALIVAGMGGLVAMRHRSR